MELEFRQVRKTYQDADRELVVLSNVSFKLPSGASIAIVGRSGTGKSTLLQLLGGLDRPTAGQIFYGERDLTKLSSDELSIFRRQNVGFVFQFHQLLGEFSALENVMMPLIISSVPRREACDRAEEILISVGLRDRLTHRPRQLSGGEQQRVAIARSVVAKPTVVLADEPTGNLDFETASEVLEVLFNIQKVLKNSLIIVTHNQELAESLDFCYEMQAGGTLVQVDRHFNATQGCLS